MIRSTPNETIEAFGAGLGPPRPIAMGTMSEIAIAMESTAKRTKRRSELETLLGASARSKDAARVVITPSPIAVDLIDISTAEPRAKPLGSVGKTSWRRNACDTTQTHGTPARFTRYRHDALARLASHESYRLGRGAGQRP